MLPESTSLPCYIHDERRCTLTGMKTPPPLSRPAIDEFKAIYHEEFGAVLSDGEVQEIALRLLQFFGILSEPR